MNNEPKDFFEQTEVVKKKSDYLLKLLVPFLIGAIVFVAVIFIFKIHQASGKTEILKILCDGFTYAAIALFVIWGLSLSSHYGTFDGLTYAGIRLVGIFVPIGGFQRHVRYGDYKLNKEAKRKRILHEFIIVAGFYGLLAGLFLILYHTV